MSECHRLLFVALQGLLDQPNAKEFTDDMGWQCPIPLLESALVR